MFGFRLWKFTAAVTGFLVGFFFTYFIVLYFWPSVNNIVYIGFGSAAAAGFLIGIILFLFPTLALFMVSIVVGFCLGVVLYDIALVYTGWPYAFFISIGICGLLMPLIAICIKKPFIVIMTSFYGGVEIAFGIATFLPPGTFPVYVDPRKEVTNPGWPVYIFFGAILVVTFLGCLLQFCVFARDISWDNVRKHICPTARDDR